MKNILIVLTTFLFINNLKAESDSLTSLKDSTYLDETADSCLLQQEGLGIVNNPLEMTKKAELKAIKNLNNITKPANWFEDAWDAFTDLFKPVWGYYEEDDYNKEGPYFLFMHSSGGATYISKQMERIRERIRVVGSSEQLIYSKVFDKAGTTTIGNCDGVIIPNPIDGSTLCGSSARAKASAFVYLVGLNSTGGYLTNTEREGYRDMI